MAGDLPVSRRAVQAVSRRLAPSALGALLILGFAAMSVLAGHQTSGVASYTGCLGPANGRTYGFAVGDVALAPCRPGDVEMHISGGDLTQVNTPAAGGLQGGVTGGAASLSLATTPAARAFSNAVVNIPDDTLVRVPLNSERWDTANLHDTTVDNSRLTATRPGIYLITGHVAWCNNSIGIRELFIATTANFTFYRLADSRVDAASTFHTGQTVSAVEKFGTGDYVELEVRQGSGVDCPLLVANDFSPYLAMTWLGPE